MARGSFRSPLAPDSSGRSRGDPDDPYDPYAPRAARRRRRPEEPAPIERALSGLVADPLYWQDQDEDYFQYVRRQYAQVYGSGKVQRDATGRQRETAPKPEYAEGRRGLDWFAPEPKPQDLHPRGPVGRSVSTGGAAPQAAGSRRPGNAPVNTPGNARRDVVGLQKALAGTGWYHWQPPHEPSGQVTEALDAAIRAFQQAHGLTVDGLVTPDGPTLRSLAQAAGLPLQAPDRDADTPPEPEPTPTPTPNPEPKPDAEPTPTPPEEREEPDTPDDPDVPDDPDAAKCAQSRRDLARLRIVLEVAEEEIQRLESMQAEQAETVWDKAEEFQIAYNDAVEKAKGSILEDAAEYALGLFLQRLKIGRRRPRDTRSPDERNDGKRRGDTEDVPDLPEPDPELLEASIKLRGLWDDYREAKAEHAKLARELESERRRKSNIVRRIDALEKLIREQCT